MMQTFTTHINLAKTFQGLETWRKSKIPSFTLIQYLTFHLKLKYKQKKKNNLDAQ